MSSLPSVRSLILLMALAILSLILTLPLTSCRIRTPEDDSPVDWVFKAPREIPWSGYGMATTPVIKDGIAVYTGGYFWRNQVYIFAVDLKTGKMLWKSEEPTEQVFIDGNRVIATSRDGVSKKIPGRERPAYVRAYNLKTGKRLWQMEAATKMHPLQILSMGRFIYCWVPEQDIFAIEPKTGEAAWHLDKRCKRPSVRESYCIGSGDRIFAAVPGAYLADINGITGDVTEIPLTESGKDPLVSMARKDDMLFLYSQTGVLISISLEDMAVKNQNEAHKLTTPLVRSGDRLFFGFTAPSQKENDINGLCIYDLKEEALVKMIDCPAPITGEPLVEGSTVYYCSGFGDGKVHAYDMKKDKLLFETTTGPLLAGPVSGDGILFVNGETGLTALSKKTGKVIFTVKAGQHKPEGRPVVWGDHVYVVGQDSNLYAIKAGRSGGMKALDPEPGARGKSAHPGSN
ncbi:MAG: PQQ-binding-like beta-propeller repeat protein [Cyanobacteria bacterium HKST-UBA02]|nr:PQQ-binding-like beta-propeller repeat protein [Cyanobacteria bacterium HKST-UBA02]